MKKIPDETHETMVSLGQARRNNPLHQSANNLGSPGFLGSANDVGTGRWNGVLGMHSGCNGRKPRRTGSMISGNRFDPEGGRGTTRLTSTVPAGCSFEIPGHPGHVAVELPILIPSFRRKSEESFN